MGYRSYGYFVIPRSAAPELERRVNEYLDKEERKRIEQKAQDEKDGGRRMIYTQTKPWNPLTGFDSVELLESKDDGKEYLRYEFNDWKWYEGYPFPTMVSQLLYETNYLGENQYEYLESPDYWLETEPVFQGSMGINQPTLVGWRALPDYAVFVRSGEDWNDVEVFDDEGMIGVDMEVDNIPFRHQEFPMTLLMIDTTIYEQGKDDGTLAPTPEWREARKKIMDLNPTNSTVDDEHHWFQWLGRREVGGLGEILDEIESMEIDGNVLSGFEIEFGEPMESFDQRSINGGDMYDYDVYVNGGWDDRDFRQAFESKGSIDIRELHPSLKE